MSYRTHYWRQYWRDFGNTYNLVYTTSEEEESRFLSTCAFGYDHITRKQALQEARENKKLRDLGLECYAPTAIFPFSFVGDESNDYRDPRNYLETVDGYLYV